MINIKSNIIIKNIENLNKYFILTIRNNNYNNFKELGGVQFSS